MPQISEKRIFKLLGSIYETVGGTSTEAWLCVYQEMAEMFQSGPGGFGLYYNNSDRLKLFASTIDPELLKLYHEYYQFVSPFRNTIVKMQVGGCFNRIKFCPDDEFMRTEIYQDFYRKLDIYQFEYHTICKSPGMNGGVSFSRPKSRKNFSSTDRNIMSFILPHLQRAFQVHLVLGEAHHENDVLVEAMSKIPQGVIVLNEAGKLVFANGSANTILARKDGLEIDRNGVVNASSLRDAKKLRIILEGVFKPNLGRILSHGGALVLERPSGLRSLQVLVSPFAEQNFLGYNPETLAFMFVCDPEQVVETVEAVLCQMYGLTQAEARLAGILAGGNSLNEACDLLEVKQNTVRTHLKHIFSKTETKRQSDLVTLIHNGPANLKSDS